MDKVTVLLGERGPRWTPAWWSKAGPCGGAEHESVHKEPLGGVNSSAELKTTCRGAHRMGKDQQADPQRSGTADFATFALAEGSLKFGHVDPSSVAAAPPPRGLRDRPVDIDMSVVAVMPRRSAAPVNSVTQPIMRAPIRLTLSSVSHGRAWSPSFQAPRFDRPRGSRSSIYRLVRGTTRAYGIVQRCIHRNNGRECTGQDLRARGTPCDSNL